MDNGSREAEQVIRLAFEGMQFMLKISGKAAMGMMDMMSALAKEKKKTSGYMRLKNLLMSGAELKVFSIKGDDKFATFAREAKDWGVVYSVVRRENEDKAEQIYEVMVKAEDASKLNRMFEKYNILADVSVIENVNSSDVQNEVPEPSVEQLDQVKEMILNNVFRVDSDGKELSEDMRKITIERVFDVYKTIKIAPSLIDHNHSTETESCIRVPGTYGDTVRYFMIENKYMADMYGNNSMYVAVISPDTPFALMDNQYHISEVVYGSELIDEHFWKTTAPAREDKIIRENPDRNERVSRDMLNMAMNPTAEQVKEINENPEALAADRPVNESQSVAFSKIYRYDGQKPAYRPSVRKEIDSILNQGNNMVDMEVVTRRESLKSRLSPYSAVNDDLYNDDAFKMVAEAIDSYQTQNGMEVSR